MASALPTGTQTSPERARWKRLALHHMWLAPIVVLAIWLRFAGLQDERLYGDEAEYAIVARYLSRDWAYLAYPDISGLGASPFVSQPPLMLYIMAAFMRVLGPTDLAAILPAALFGVATVVVVWFLGNRLGGRLLGGAAAIILAGLRFHVDMSRRAMTDAGYVFFLLLAAYFLVAWMQDRSRRSAIGVGVAAAGACMTKLPGVLVLPIILVALLYVLGVVLVTRARGHASAGDVRETIIQGGLGALPVVVGGLLYLGFLAYLEAIGDMWVKLMWQLGRVDTSQAKVQEVAAIQRPPTWYFTDPQFGFSHELGGVLFALAIIGLLVALLRFGMHPVRHKEHLVVPLMTAVLLAFFLYSDRKEGFYLLPFAPLACVLAGYSAEGLRRMLAWAGLKAAPRSASRLAPAALAIGLVLVAVPAVGAARESWTAYALGQTPEKFFGAGSDEAAAWIHERDPSAAQYGTLLGRWTVFWYNEQETYHWYIDHTFVESQIESGHLKYIVYENYLDLSFDREYMRQLITKYNGEEVARFEHGWGQVQVFELHP